MDILRLLQTLGICVGSVALVAIAIMMFFILMSFVPTLPPDIEPEPLTALNFDPELRRKKRRSKKADTALTPDEHKDETPQQPT